MFQRAEENFDIQQEGPVFNVIDIIINALLYGSIASESVYLSPTSHARANLVLDHVAGNFLAKLFHKIGKLRAGPHKAHIAQQDVKKLR